MIAWVAQDTHLFNTTIRANIALARPDASKDEIAEAARAAQLGRVGSTRCPTASTPRSASRGPSSQGASASALPSPGPCWRGAPVLVLDEPTSGLDEATAERLLEDLMASTGGKSLLYVTHRLDELEGFDDVVVIEQGRAVEGRR